MDIADLIKRVEAATGPDREVDAAVGHALGVEGKPRNVHRRGHYVAGKPVLLRVAYDFPAYTASVDAVIGLIGEKMPGANWQLEFMSGRHLSVLYPDAASGSFSGDGAGTPALSLLLAFLRAWEQRGDG